MTATDDVQQKRGYEVYHTRNVILSIVCIANNNLPRDQKLNICVFLELKQADHFSLAHLLELRKRG